MNFRSVSRKKTDSEAPLTLVKVSVQMVRGDLVEQADNRPLEPRLASTRRTNFTAGLKACATPVVRWSGSVRSAGESKAQRVAANGRPLGRGSVIRESALR